METYSGKLLREEDYEDIKIDTEDYATVLLRFNNGAHGSMTVNQVAAGRKNRLYFENLWFEIFCRLGLRETKRALDREKECK
jgi:predicted dehydrogenase